jgi:hypothetical protein
MIDLKDAHPVKKRMHEEKTRRKDKNSSFLLLLLLMVAPIQKKEQYALQGEILLARGDGFGRYLFNERFLPYFAFAICQGTCHQ